MQDDDTDLIRFSDDEVAPRPAESTSVWKILIVDDDTDVHHATEFALANTPVLGRPLVFLHAYSAAESVDLLRVERDIAVILLDVVMERDDAGLQLVRIIRGELALHEVRIILRTGQPGYAPGIDAIRDYDINDYKTKSELSRNRLFTTLTAAVRSYEQVHTIDSNRRGLRAIIDSTARLLAADNVGDFASILLQQIAGLLGIPAQGLVCAMERGGDVAKMPVLAAGGTYGPSAGQTLGEVPRRDVTTSVAAVIAGQRNQFERDRLTLRFACDSGYEMAAFLELSRPLSEVELQLLDVFCTNVRISLDNVLLFGQLKDHAYIDQLLRIPNRLAFVRTADARLKSQRDCDVVALVDIDRFSELNDALGHSYGDRLLGAVADRLARHFGAEVLIARVAADTFGLLGANDRIDPERIRETTSQPFQIDGAEHLLTFTAGLARLCDVKGAGSDAVKCANIALCRAKEGRRGEAIYYQHDMELDTRNRVQLLQALRAAFERDRLFVVYQPQISLETRRVVGLEALLRWRNDQGQLVPPSQFIPLAESSGLIVSMGGWVLRSACLALRQLQRAGIGDVRMAVNVSVSQLRHPRFLTTVDTVLDECDADRELIELEITESIAMLDLDFMVALIDALRSRGIAVAIDDFGTGFSSLSYLERLNVNRLKIDRSFVAQMSLGTSSQRIVETIIQLGRTLGLELIAEGIENEAEATALTAMGCHEGQGFLFARPMDLSEAMALIQRTNT